jgi:hypothetical protein
MWSAPPSPCPISSNRCITHPPTPHPQGTTLIRIEPKTFLANERTFLSWLHMSVTIGSIAAALLGLSGNASGVGGEAWSLLGGGAMIGGGWLGHLFLAQCFGTTPWFLRC